MKKTFIFGLFLVAFSFLPSCERIEDTDIEVIENQLKDFVEENNLTTCTIIVMYGESRYTEHSDVEFTIENGFVVVHAAANGGTFQERYNLLYMTKYMLDIDGKLALYFADTHF